MRGPENVVNMQLFAFNKSLYARLISECSLDTLPPKTTMLVNFNYFCLGFVNDMAFRIKFEMSIQI